jgi:Leucine rich repeat
LKIILNSISHNFRFLLIFLSIFATNAEQITLQCEYETVNWNYPFESVYQCAVRSETTITEFLTEDVQVTGTHAAGKTNDDVQSFKCDDCGMHYFPRGLHKIFKNLLLIHIDVADLKVINKQDLEQFDKLQELWLPGNEIEVLEQDLFIGNPNLEHVFLSSNQIKFIHSTAFENLKNLKTLQLKRNTCINQGVLYNSSEVPALIQTAKDQCTSDVASYKRHMDNNPYELERQKMKKEQEAEAEADA